MIITTKNPYTTKEVDKLKEQFEVYIKTVIDIDKKICGGDIDLKTGEIDFNSFVNI